MPSNPRSTILEAFFLFPPIKVVSDVNKQTSGTYSGITLLSLFVVECHCICPLALSHDFSRVKLNQHSTVSLQFLDGYAETEIIE